MTRPCSRSRRRSTGPAATRSTSSPMTAWVPPAGGHRRRGQRLGSHRRVQLSRSTCAGPRCRSPTDSELPVELGRYRRRRVDSGVRRPAPESTRASGTAADRSSRASRSALGVFDTELAGIVSYGDLDVRRFAPGRLHARRFACDPGLPLAGQPRQHAPRNASRAHRGRHGRSRADDHLRRGQLGQRPGARLPVRARPRRSHDGCADQPRRAAELRRHERGRRQPAGLLRQGRTTAAASPTARAPGPPPSPLRRRRPPCRPPTSRRRRPSRTAAAPVARITKTTCTATRCTLTRHGHRRRVLGRDQDRPDDGALDLPQHAASARAATRPSRARSTARASRASRRSPPRSSRSSPPSCPTARSASPWSPSTRRATARRCRRPRRSRRRSPKKHR